MSTPLSKGSFSLSGFKNPCMTLSIAGVDFSLVPSDNSTTSMSFLQNSDKQVAFDLNAFTGRLLVTPTTSKVTQEQTNAFSVKVTPNLSDNASSACKKRNAPSDDDRTLETTTAMASHHPTPLLTRLLQEDDDEDTSNLQDGYQNNESTTTPAKKLKPSAPEEEEHDTTTTLPTSEDNDNKSPIDDDEAPVSSQSQTQETLLAQMDFSQTQFDLSQTQPSNDDDHVMSDAASSAADLPVLQRTLSVDRTSHLKDILQAAESRPTSPVVTSLHQNDNVESSNSASADDVTPTQESIIEKDISNKPDQEVVSAEEKESSNPQTVNQQAHSTDGENAKAKKSTSAKSKKKTQKKTVEATSSDVSSDDSSAASSKKSTTKITRRVSIGSPEKQVAPAVQPPPSERWGHTVTPINNGRFLVYGGQTCNPKTKIPQTLDDLYLYNTDKKTWFKPFSGDGLPRQWHTSTYLPDRQLLIAFGGESMNPKSGKVRTHSNVTVLDTELMVWYPPTVSGEVPSGRSGHSAAMVDQDLVVMGGVKGCKWLNTVSVLNTQNWVWRQPKIQGSAPKPRSYHSATTVGSRVVVFGGNDADESFATVHVLEKMPEGDTWQWTHPMVTGYPPKPRTGHSATLLPDGKNICIYGGWDPNDDDAKDDEGLIWNDAFLLNTETWQWKQLPKSFSKRVGHEAILMPRAANETSIEVLAFGGRIPRDQFTNDMEILEIPTET